MFQFGTSPKPYESILDLLRKIRAAEERMRTKSYAFQDKQKAIIASDMFAKCRQFYVKLSIEAEFFEQFDTSNPAICIGDSKLEAQMMKYGHIGLEYESVSDLFFSRRN